MIVSSRRMEGSSSKDLNRIQGDRRSGGLEANLIWRKMDQGKKYGGALVGKLITDKNLNKLTTIQMIHKGWSLEKNEDLERSRSQCIFVRISAKG